MRRSLGTLTASLLAGATLLVTAGCGSSSSVALDPASDPAGNPSRTPGSVSGATVLPLISMTGGGGRVSTTATTLGSAEDVSRFVSQFGPQAMRLRIREAVRGRVGQPGHQVVGQVVGLGCDRPPGVDVVVGEDGHVSLVPHDVPSPLQECLAAVTTVAIADLPIP